MADVPHGKSYPCSKLGALNELFITCALPCADALFAGCVKPNAHLCMSISRIQVGRVPFEGVLFSLGSRQEHRHLFLTPTLGAKSVPPDSVLS